MPTTKDVTAPWLHLGQQAHRVRSAAGALVRTWCEECSDSVAPVSRPRPTAGICRRCVVAERLDARLVYEARR